MASVVEGSDAGRLEEIRQLCGTIVTRRNGQDCGVEYCTLLDEYLRLGGEKSDFIVRVGENMFEYFVHGGMHDKSKQGPIEDDIEANPEGSRRLEFDYLETFMIDCFKAVGVPDKEAAVAANVLIEADKRGIDSHGVGRLKPIYFDRIKAGILYPYKPITMIKETATTAFLDGHMGLGLYIGPHCMQLAIEKAKQYGVGFVVCQNSTHYGIAGYYTTMATDAGCIGWTGTNARPSIAPTFGVEPCLGTNPMTFGIPTDEPFPFVIDCATSINQRGKIEKYARLGMPTPRGMVIDIEGKERTDTDQVSCCISIFVRDIIMSIMVLFRVDSYRHGERNMCFVPYGRRWRCFGWLQGLRLGYGRGAFVNSFPVGPVRS
jgi:hypothetical protein